MQENWSLVLNVVLLIGVVIAISRLMKVRRQSFASASPQVLPSRTESPVFDEILSVRRISPQDDEAAPVPALTPATRPEATVEREVCAKEPAPRPRTRVLFLLAGEGRQFAGYELLQTVLSAGLRFGDGQIFHRHQQANGRGTVLCSLACATPSGVFDLQNIGAFSVRGLCLFMEQSGDSAVDEERFHAWLDTARYLADGLNAMLLDADRRALTEEAAAKLFGEIVGEKACEPADVV